MVRLPANFVGEVAHTFVSCPCTHLIFTTVTSILATCLNSYDQMLNMKRSTTLAVLTAVSQVWHPLLYSIQVELYTFLVVKYSYKNCTLSSELRSRHRFFFINFKLFFWSKIPSLRSPLTIHLFQAIWPFLAFHLYFVICYIIPTLFLLLILSHNTGVLPAIDHLEVIFMIINVVKRSFRFCRRPCANACQAFSENATLPSRWYVTRSTLFSFWAFIYYRWTTKFLLQKKTSRDYLIRVLPVALCN